MSDKPPFEKFQVFYMGVKYASHRYFEVQVQISMDVPLAEIQRRYIEDAIKEKMERESER